MIQVKVERLHTLTGHKDCVYALEKSREDAVFYSASGDGMVVSWDMEDPETGRVLVKVPNSVYAMRFLEERNQLIVGQNFEGLHLIDLEQRKEVRSLKTGNTPIFDIQFYEGNIYVALGNGQLLVIGLEDWVVHKNIQLSEKSLRAFALSPLRQELAIAGSDYHIYILDLQSQERKKKFEAHHNSVFSLQYSPDETQLLSAGRDARLKVWNVSEDYALFKDIPAHLYAINHLVYSPSKKYIATASMDKSVKIWDASSFELLKVLDRSRHAGHGTSVNKLLWTNYQGRLVSGSDDRTMSVWDLKFARD